MSDILLTTAGIAKISAAAGSATQVAISHIAIGDGLGVVYTPDPGQVGLRREKARAAIERRHRIEPDAWRVIASFPPGAQAYQVREIGFFDSEGTLIAIWSSADLGQAGAIEYLVNHVLQFSAADSGLVIVHAPDDALFDLAVKTAAALANLQLEQLRQAERLDARAS
ncbi:phage tail-collar fiber domain-containing protein [Profundibacterium mesophilum]|uniref:Fels-2 prophage protein n=1 Tax=Profundibacterium mesophilum KAUST100406-0324 TaxID=1037889 RepID=A0A921NXV9_9RHOB|nr:phage tail protein [Profundibacterium mesophilum]KAF0676734.1 Fels-2 prophage protein [Profundibacterium mesophilum KAUST100406-0324]